MLRQGRGISRVEAGSGMGEARVGFTERWRDRCASGGALGVKC